VYKLLFVLGNLEDMSSLYTLLINEQEYDEALLVAEKMNSVLKQAKCFLKLGLLENA